MRSILRRTPPIVILLGVCTLIGFGYSMFQMISSFANDEQSPEYERMPPAAFALPEAEVLVDPQQINVKRLPDSAYEEIAQKGGRIATALGERKINAGVLRRAGMGRSAAENNAGVLREAASTLEGRKVSAPGQVSIEPSSLRSANARVSFEIFSETLGSSSLTLSMGFVQRDGQWRLQSIRIE